MEESIFRRDSTERFSCRSGDYMMLFGYNGPFGNNKYTMKGVWGFKDGDFVTLTNRRADLPSWFELHPNEVAGQLAFEFKEKLDNGYEPKDIMEGENIWRILAGDRLIWVGHSRNDKRSKEILSVITFQKAALAIGESQNINHDHYRFGVFNHKTQDKSDRDLCEKGFNVVMAMDIPRTAAASNQWRLG